MKLRVIRRDHIVIGIAAIMFALGLVSINVLWPDAFGVFIAIGGVVGVLMVIYEVRLTKRLAQAEFIRDLQSSFSADANIGELWRKILLEEEITPQDRPLVSSYLTFFETLYLLLKRGALDPLLTDDLFRNRFFKAVGNEGVLKVLVGEAGSFVNIHDLIRLWHDYLLQNSVPIHEGYYRYVEGLTKAKGYGVETLDASNLPELLDLQEDVISTLGDPSWLRANTEEMLGECLREHATRGIRKDGQLVAAAILYDGGTGAESIKHYFTGDEAAMRSSINLKLVLARPEHQRMGLSRALVELMEEDAVRLGKTEIMATIHPSNVPSKGLFELLGYRRVGRVSTTYGRRDVFARALPAPNRRWAR